MALRCMLRKLGNNNKFIHSKARAVMLGTFQVIQHQNKELLSMPFPTHSSPLHFRDFDNRAPVPMATGKQSFDYHTELGGLRTARFALEKFNKIKKAKLQLVKVLGLWMKPRDCLYVVIMEAVDADGMARLYQARVQLHVTEGVFLEAFYRCSKSHFEVKYAKLFHHLDNFYDSMYGVRTDRGTRIRIRSPAQRSTRGSIGMEAEFYH